MEKVVDILNENLKPGEYFIFTKLEEGGYGITISEEREEQLKGFSPKIRKLLNVLKEEEVTEGFFTGKATNFKLKTN